MVGRTKEVALQPVPGDCNGGYTLRLPDYATRAEDFEWAQRELGDVPMRIIDAQWKPSVTTVTLIPVESLGRES